MDHKKSPTSRRTKRQSKALEENYWDCSVCTYRNTAEAFKCLMCDIRKGTSTRKPRINPQLVAQQVAQQFNPTPAKTNKREKSDKKSLSDRRSSKKKHHLRKLKNVDRNSAETREVTVNNITVMITEYKPKPAKKLVSDQSGQSSRASSESESSSEAPSAAADSDSRSSLLKLKNLRKLMEEESKKGSETRLAEKLKRTTNRIQNARKNLKLAEKEAAEFLEIHKLLNDDISLDINIKNTKEVQSEDTSVIPLKFPGVKVFNDDLVFSLFRENNCDLKNFLESEENCLVFGRNESVPSEEYFRNLISSQITEVLMPEDRNSSTVCLYVLYLLSVHQEPEFVRACCDFLKQQVFYLCPEDVFPIFINFGGKREELFDFCEETFLKRFHKKDGPDEIFLGATFPFFNMEMFGQVLLYCITRNFVVINPAIKPLVRGLAKITLDPKVCSGSLLPLYSTILSALCGKIQKDFKLEEIVDWVYFGEEHLFNQLEICRVLSKSIAPAVQESLVLRTCSQILDLKTTLFRPPIKIDHVKLLLLKLKFKELPPVELFCILQLLNGSLPGLTATLKDSTDIRAALTCLEKKISKTEDPVDLIRIKLEAAKVGNIVTNNTNDRFAVQNFQCSN